MKGISHHKRTNSVLVSYVEGSGTPSDQWFILFDLDSGQGVRTVKWNYNSQTSLSNFMIGGEFAYSTVVDQGTVQFIKMPYSLDTTENPSVIFTELTNTFTDASGLISTTPGELTLGNPILAIAVNSTTPITASELTVVMQTPFWQSDVALAPGSAAAFDVQYNGMSDPLEIKVTLPCSQSGLTTITHAVTGAPTGVKLEAAGSTTGRRLSTDYTSILKIPKSALSFSGYSSTNKFVITSTV